MEVVSKTLSDLQCQNEQRACTISDMTMNSTRLEIGDESLSVPMEGVRVVGTVGSVDDISEVDSSTYVEGINSGSVGDTSFMALSLSIPSPFITTMTVEEMSIVVDWSKVSERFKEYGFDVYRSADQCKIKWLCNCDNNQEQFKKGVWTQEEV